MIRISTPLTHGLLDGVDIRIYIKIFITSSGPVRENIAEAAELTESNPSDAHTTGTRRL